MLEIVLSVIGIYFLAGVFTAYCTFTVDPFYKEDYSKEDIVTQIIWLWPIYAVVYGFVWLARGILAASKKTREVLGLE